MNCPTCARTESRVLRTVDDGRVVVRRRQCDCGERWSTEERVQRKTVGDRQEELLSVLPVAENSATPSASRPLPVAQKNATPSAFSPQNATGSVSRVIPDPIRSSSDPGSPPESSKPNERNYNSLATRPAGRRVASGALAVALGAFCEIWEERYEEKYRPTPGDCAQLATLVRRTPAAELDELPRAFEAYLDDLDPFVAQQQRHSLRYFCTSGGQNKYRTSAPVLSAREARGVEAARQFVNGTGGNHARPKR